MKNNFHPARRLAAAAFAAVIFCNPQRIAQTAVESANAPLKLLPPYGELPPTFWEQHATGISSAGLAVVLLAAVALRRFSRTQPETVIPPEVQAREALQALCDRPEDRAVLSRVSQITRRYFIGAFQLAAGEMTTTEFNRELARSEKPSPELAAATAEFLQQCDDRKFSPAAEPEKLDAAKSALNLVAQAEQRRAQLRRLAETQSSAPGK